MKSSLKKGKKLEFDPDTTKAYGPLLDDYVKMYPDDIVGLKAQLNFKLHEGHYQEAVVILDRLIKVIFFVLPTYFCLNGSIYGLLKC